MKTANPRRWFFAPCGLDCYGCPIRLRTEEELHYWAQQKVDLDKVKCDGCRSERDENHWSPTCKILEYCIYKRKYEFCAQCPDFPCPVLEDWGREYEHHAQAVRELEHMKRAGIEQWLREKGVDE